MNSQLNGETKKEILRKQCEKCHYGDTERKLLKYIRESLIEPGECLTKEVTETGF